MSMVAAFANHIPGKKRYNPSNNNLKSPHNKQSGKRRKHEVQLPITPCEERIVSELKTNDVLVIVGETASGKTTQIPQYIYNAGLLAEGKCIAVTQPRRVATISLGRRVANEMGTKVGQLVGYCVRFEDKTSKDTRIKFLTDGMLLREAISKKNLKKYGVIILDEAHERTVNTDVLFGLLKKIQSQRVKTPLKLIIMSATLNADHFSKFFDSAKVLYIQGRQFPIKTLYSKVTQKDYAHASLVTALQIHQEMPPEGDILVFLTGQEEIEHGHKLLTECNACLPALVPKIAVFCLFGALPTSQQVGVFSRPPPGHRKIILSTNIAETSLTIRGLKYVVDSCRVKQKAFNPKVGMESLQVMPISKAQARQRQGRSGREGPGICYRMLTEAEYDALAEVETPEIQRCRLSTVILNLVNLGINNVFEFQWIDKPPEQTISSAVTDLVALDAMTGSRELELTPLGKSMAAFPLSPHYSKMIIKSRELSCSADMITLVALLSVDSIFYNPQNKSDITTAVRQKFYNRTSDHVTLVRVYKSAEENNFNPDWCQRHYLNLRALQTAANVRKQLKQICKKIGVPLITSKKWEENICSSLLFGLLDNVAVRQPDSTYVSLSNRQQAKLHPSSVLCQLPPESAPQMVVYDEMVLTSANYLRTCSVVEEGWYQRLVSAKGQDIGSSGVELGGAS
ncbi:hypothetical protein ACHWQZ_G015255 [Mnemiopsis leidyi]